MMVSAFTKSFLMFWIRFQRNRAPRAGAVTPDATAKLTVPNRGAFLTRRANV